MSNEGADETVIRVEGVFDDDAAQRLARALEDASGETVRIDLTSVRELHDFGIAALARALAGHRDVAVTGLRQHQLRLLRYFGIDAGPGDPSSTRELQ